MHSKFNSLQPGCCAPSRRVPLDICRCLVEGTSRGLGAKEWQKETTQFRGPAHLRQKPMSLKSKVLSYPREESAEAQASMQVRHGYKIYV